MNVIEFNPYQRLSFDELINESNKQLHNFQPEKALLLMKEFTRRLTKDK